MTRISVHLNYAPSRSDNRPVMGRGPVNKIALKQRYDGRRGHCLVESGVRGGGCAFTELRGHNAMPCVIGPITATRLDSIAMVPSKVDTSRASCFTMTR